jgi:hypothetical protein
VPAQLSLSESLSAQYCPPHLARRVIKIIAACIDTLGGQARQTFWEWCLCARKRVNNSMRRPGANALPHTSAFE